MWTQRRAITACFLLPCLSSFSADRLRSVLANRRSGLTVVLENVRKENVALVARTAEALGIASLHLIYTESMEAHLRGFSLLSEKARAAQLSRISRSATDWLGIRMHRSVSGCVEDVLAAGFDTFVATTPSTLHTVSLYSEQAPDEEDWASGRVALLFGSEGHGLSDELLATADVCVSVPQSGMTQSLNVATCAAIVISEVIRRRDAAGAETSLSQDELERLESELLPAAGSPVRFHNKAAVRAEARLYKKSISSVPP